MKRGTEMAVYYRGPGDNAVFEGAVPSMTTSVITLFSLKLRVKAVPQD